MQPVISLDSVASSKLAKIVKLIRISLLPSSAEYHVVNVRIKTAMREVKNWENSKCQYHDLNDSHSRS